MAKWSKAPDLGSGPKGRGFKSHSCHWFLIFYPFWHIPILIFPSFLFPHFHPPSQCYFHVIRYERAWVEIPQLSLISCILSFFGTFLYLFFLLSYFHISIRLLNATFMSSYHFYSLFLYIFSITFPFFGTFFILIFPSFICTFPSAFSTLLSCHHHIISLQLNLCY